MYKEEELKTIEEIFFNKDIEFYSIEELKAAVLKN